MERKNFLKIMLKKIKQFRNNKILFISTLIVIFSYLILGGITFIYSGVMVIPSYRTHMDTNFYPYDNIELFERSLLIGWKTIPQREAGTDAGIFLGYRYQRYGSGWAYLEFNCYGWQTKKGFQYTDRLGQIEDIESRRCIGIITYKYEWIE